RTLVWRTLRRPFLRRSFLRSTLLRRPLGRCRPFGGRRGCRALSLGRPLRRRWGRRRLRQMSRRLRSPCLASRWPSLRLTVATTGGRGRGHDTGPRERVGFGRCGNRGMTLVHGRQKLMLASRGRDVRGLLGGRGVAWLASRGLLFRRWARVDAAWSAAVADVVDGGVGYHRPVGVDVGHGGVADIVDRTGVIEPVVTPVSSVV